MSVRQPHNASMGKSSATLGPFLIRAPLECTVRAFAEPLPDRRLLAGRLLAEHPGGPIVINQTHRELSLRPLNYKDGYTRYTFNKVPEGTTLTVAMELRALRLPPLAPLSALESNFRKSVELLEQQARGLAC